MSTLNTRPDRLHGQRVCVNSDLRAVGVIVGLVILGSVVAFIVLGCCH